jgi:hypothetical protein
MNENFISQSICRRLRNDGYSVATEVANFHRCADIAAIAPSGEIVIVECKLFDMKRVVEQSHTHRLSADRVMVATLRRTLKPATQQLIRAKGLGLYFVDAEGEVELAWQSKVQDGVWPLRREQLRKRILEGKYI